MCWVYPRLAQQLQMMISHQFGPPIHVITQTARISWRYTIVIMNYNAIFCEISGEFHLRTLCRFSRNMAPSSVANTNTPIWCLFVATEGLRCQISSNLPSSSYEKGNYGSKYYVIFPYMEGRGRGGRQIGLKTAHRPYVSWRIFAPPLVQLPADHLVAALLPLIDTCQCPLLRSVSD